VYFDWLQENPGKHPEREEMEKQFLEEAAPHFEYFWEHSHPEYRRVLMTVREGAAPGIEELHICHKLVREGYLLEEGDHFRLFSRVFLKYIHNVESLASQERGFDRSASGARRDLALSAKVNQYQVAFKAGEGGMGVVYQAQDDSLGRKVALKVIKPELLEMQMTRKRFLQEARAAAALNHPAITSIYELFEYKDQIVLVLEWLEGLTIKEKIIEAGRLERKQLLRWLIEACSGLSAAHQAGIIHRDIKSSNLMITSDNHLKILDFGLAKRWEVEGIAEASALTVQGTLLGTLDYMSPEQACGKVVDERTDLFSMGVVLFEGLTGKPPFSRDSAPATLHAIVNEPPPDLGLYQIEEAERLNRVVSKLLKKNPARRYRSALHLEKDLRDLLRPRKGFFSWLRH